MSMVAEVSLLLANPTSIPCPALVPNTTRPVTQTKTAPSPQVACRMIRHAMQRQDDLVISLNYRDRRGKVTQRIISPIRFLSSDRFLAFCLCRCEPRQFQLDRCSDVQLKWAADYVMPVQMTTVPTV